MVITFKYKGVVWISDINSWFNRCSHHVIKEVMELIQSKVTNDYPLDKKFCLWASSIPDSPYIYLIKSKML